MNSNGCRETAPMATFEVPAQVARGAIQKDKLPMKVRFDGGGPLVEIEVGQWKTVVPLVPAVLQREIYHHGPRYWRQWAQYEQTVVEQKQTEETKNKQKQLKTKLFWIGGIVAVLVIVSVVTVVLSRKRIWGSGSSVPKLSPDIRTATVIENRPQLPGELFSASGGKLESINIP